MTELSDDQLEFLALHVKRVVVMWKWLFRDATLRASSAWCARSIGRQDLDDLVARGFMTMGCGAADVRVTALGHEVVA